VCDWHIGRNAAGRIARCQADCLEPCAYCDGPTPQELILTLSGLTFPTTCCAIGGASPWSMRWSSLPTIDPNGAFTLTRANYTASCLWQYARPVPANERGQMMMFQGVVCYGDGTDMADAEYRAVILYQAQATQFLIGGVLTPGWSVSVWWCNATLTATQGQLWAGTAYPYQCGDATISRGIEFCSHTAPATITSGGVVTIERAD
jgi:hypothetical protein